jgi:AcrR family transcriptional regulator
MSVMVLGMTLPAQVQRRKDAQRNREAIIEVARALFADSPDFPMSEVAKRAGVGQGTLYRNFADRSRLAIAVMEDEVNHLEALAVQHAGDADAFFFLVRALAEGMARTPALGELASRDPRVHPAQDLARSRMGALMAEPLRQAKENGTVRRDFTLDDLVVVLWMLRGASLLSRDPASRGALVSRALTLAFDGIAPRGTS